MRKKTPPKVKAANLKYAKKLQIGCLSALSSLGFTLSNVTQEPSSETREPIQIMRIKSMMVGILREKGVTIAICGKIFHRADNWVLKAEKTHKVNKCNGLYEVVYLYVLKHLELLEIQQPEVLCEEEMEEVLDEVEEA